VQLKPRLRFRFSVETDIAEFGDRWWVYDEEAITSLPSDKLIKLEEVVGSYFRVMEQFREGKVLGILAAMWISLTLAGRDVDWETFNPIALRVEWEEAPSPLASGEDPAPDSSSSPDPTVVTA